MCHASKTPRSKSINIWPRRLKDDPARTMIDTVMQMHVVAAKAWSGLIPINPLILGEAGQLARTNPEIAACPDVPRLIAIASKNRRYSDNILGADLGRNPGV